MKKIHVFDTTLRDGEQSAGTMLRPEEKLQIALQLEKLGVDVIEAGFPISSPGDFKAVALIARKVKKSVIAALARCVEKDIRVAAEALKGTRKSRVHVFLPSSDIHLERKLKKTREEALKIAVESVKLAQSLAKEVEYSPEDATRTDFEYLVKIVKAVIEAGAKIINIPDTVGYSTPEEFGLLIKRLQKRLPELGKKIILSAHCHDDLGMATANSLLAVMNGANQIEGTINGVGERAGNAALEEIVMILKTRKDLYGNLFNTGINPKEIKNTSRLVSDLLKIPIQPNKAVVGKNAFAHSSGIHQDGVLKDRRTYEIMQPEDIGGKKNEIILTARSGRHGLRYKLQSLGYKDLTEKQIEKIYQEFIELADSKKTVTDEDLKNIASKSK
ncbi:MAG: 2-isopropylmalate synthase [bacterium]|nr:2-isopropylmalate synthase [bacterium]